MFAMMFVRTAYPMKEWCYTNNILQVDSWRCLVVQIVFDTLMTASMTSQSHKIAQFFPLQYLSQYFSKNVDQEIKILEMLMAILLEYSTSCIISGNKVRRNLKMMAILKTLKY